MIAASKRLLFIFVFIHFQATWLSLRVRSELRITHRTLIELFLLLIFLSLSCHWFWPVNDSYARSNESLFETKQQAMAYVLMMMEMICCNTSLH